MTDTPDQPSQQPQQLGPRDTKPGELTMHDSSLPPIGEHRAPGSHIGLLDVDEPDHAIVLGADDFAGAAPLSPIVFKQLLLALATFSALVMAAYVVPLPWAQPWRADEDYVPFWNIIGRELMGQGAQLEADVEQAEQVDELARALDGQQLAPDTVREVIVAPPPDELRYLPYQAHEQDPTPEELVVSLENPDALASYYTALSLTDAGYQGAITRTGHWGDSVLGNDGITSAIRRRMQARFGDAGHGFHALKKYDASYKHQGVRFEELGGVRWNSCFIRNRCKDDGHYGYGGVTVWSSGGAHSKFATAEKGSFGLSAGVFELWYVKRPKGGKLRVKIDEQVHTIDTALSPEQAGAALRPGQTEVLVDDWARFVVPDGAHTFEVRSIGGGTARAYGVVIERELPGVIWDGMALIGSFTNRLAAQDATHLAAQLGHREVELMAFTFGGNDMTREKSDLRRTMDAYVEDYGRVIELFRTARPEAACLIIGPVDHGERVGGRIVSRPIVARMTEAQRQVAREHGCAFFDTLAAMGGDGAIARWHTRGLMSADLAHPSAAGHKVLGTMIYAALIDGYIAFRKAHEGQLVRGGAGP